MKNKLLGLSPTERLMYNIIKKNPNMCQSELTTMLCTGSYGQRCIYVLQSRNLIKAKRGDHNSKLYRVK